MARAPLPSTPEPDDLDRPLWAGPPPSIMATMSRIVEHADARAIKRRRALDMARSAQATSPGSRGPMVAAAA